MVAFEYSSALLMTMRCVQAFRIGGEWKAKGGFLYLVFKQGRVSHPLKDSVELTLI